MKKLLRLSPFVVLSLLAFACADQTDDEEEQGQSDSALKSCPSPVEDREGFARCVQRRASKATKGAPTTTTTNGGGQCTNVSIHCDGNAPCTCECTGKGCREVCCP